MVKSDLRGSSFTLFASLKKCEHIVEICSKHNIHFSNSKLGSFANGHSPNNEGDAKRPSSSKVWIFEDRGIFCKGVVMDDGWLLIMERLTKEPLLTNKWEMLCSARLNLFYCWYITLNFDLEKYLSFWSKFEDFHMKVARKYFSFPVSRSVTGWENNEISWWNKVQKMPDNVASKALIIILDTFGVEMITFRENHPPVKMRQKFKGTVQHFGKHAKSAFWRGVKIRRHQHHGFGQG